MEDGMSGERDIRDRVDLNIRKIQEMFEVVFGGKQMTVEGFMMKPKGIDDG